MLIRTHMLIMHTHMLTANTHTRADTCTHVLTHAQYTHPHMCRCSHAHACSHTHMHTLSCMPARSHAEGRARQTLRRLQGGTTRETGEASGDAARAAPAPTSATASVPHTRPRRTLHKSRPTSSRQRNALPSAETATCSAARFALRSHLSPVTAGARPGHLISLFMKQSRDPV